MRRQPWVKLGAPFISLMNALFSHLQLRLRRTMGYKVRARLILAREFDIQESSSFLADVFTACLMYVRVRELNCV